MAEDVEWTDPYPDMDLEDLQEMLSGQLFDAHSLVDMRMLNVWSP